MGGIGCLRRRECGAAFRLPARGSGAKVFRGVGERMFGVAGERGSALVLAVVVSALLTILGLLFALTGEDEGRMARNALRGSQALYAAEAAARCARDWFERPDPAGGF